MNGHDLRHKHLKLACLPIPPPPRNVLLNISESALCVNPPVQILADYQTENRGLSKAARFQLKMTEFHAETCPALRGGAQVRCKAEHIRHGSLRVDNLAGAF